MTRRTEIYGYLVAHGPSTVAEIADGLGAARSHTSAVLRSLSESGDVRRAGGVWVRASERLSWAQPAARPVSATCGCGYEVRALAGVMSLLRCSACGGGFT